MLLPGLLGLRRLQGLWGLFFESILCFSPCGSRVLDCLGRREVWVCARVLVAVAGVEAAAKRSRLVGGIQGV